MKSYSQVYQNSRKAVLSERKALFDSQKAAIVNVLKENYMITGKISDLPANKKAEMAKKLAEYWSPKTGINQAGIRLLNENMITLSKESTPEDIKLYIQKYTKKNLMQITECFRANRVDVIVESFTNDVKTLTGRTLKEKFIIDTVWDIVGNRIKNSL